jgi:hypothetical protein
MKIVITALLLAGSILHAQAQSRPSTPDLTCAAAAALVDRQGAALLTTGPGTYDRFVRSQQFCERGEYPRRAWAKTRDDAQCVIGYTCGARETQAGR